MSTTIVYFNNGKFLIWDLDSVKRLRDRRVVGQFVGCIASSPNQLLSSGLPYFLSHNAAKLILTQKLGSFKKLSDRTNIDENKNKLEFDKLTKKLFEKENIKYVARRKEEMQKRKIPITKERLKRIGSMSMDKLELQINKLPQIQLSAFEIVEMNESDVEASFDVKDLEYKVYEDLWKLGFHLGSGTKFGADFLAYRGDPVIYHAQYAVRSFSNLYETMKSDKFHHCDINAFHRLCHSAHKTPLIGIVGESKVQYYTLPSKEFVNTRLMHRQFLPLDIMSETEKYMFTKEGDYKKAPNESLYTRNNKSLRLDDNC